MVDKSLTPQFSSAPHDWKLIPLKRLMRVTSGAEVSVEVPQSNDAVPVYGSGVKPFKYTNRSISAKAVVLFGRKGTLGQPFLVEPPFWAVDTAYIATPRENVELAYLYYLLKTFDWQPFITNTAKPSLVANDILPEKVPLPQYQGQVAILRYLDAKTAEIDGLIEKLRREVELLEQYRRELIAHTVTRGLNPDASIHDSGIDWIGDGPSDWNHFSAKSLFVRRTELERKDDIHLTPSQTYGVIPQEDFIKLSGTKPTLKLSETSKMRHVEPGDFIIHLRSFQGGLELSGFQGKVSGAYTVITPREPSMVNHSYFKWLFKSSPFIRGLASLTNQLRDGQSINFTTFSRTSYLVPPIEQQQQIAEFLDMKTSRIDSTISDINKQTALLGRYRKQVINDAVTGKIRVGEVA